MPQRIEIPGAGVFEVADGLTDQQIDLLVRNEILPSVQASTPSLQPMVQQPQPAPFNPLSRLPQAPPQFPAEQQKAVISQALGQAHQTLATPLVNLPVPSMETLQELARSALGVGPTRAPVLPAPADSRLGQTAQGVAGGLQKLAGVVPAITSPYGLATLAAQPVPFLGPLVNLALGAGIGAHGAGTMMGSNQPKEIGGGLVDLLLGALGAKSGGSALKNQTTSLADVMRLVNEVSENARFYGARNVTPKQEGASMQAAEIVQQQADMPRRTWDIQERVPDVVPPQRQLGMQIPPDALAAAPLEVRQLAERVLTERPALAIPGEAAALDQLSSLIDAGPRMVEPGQPIARTALRQEGEQGGQVSYAAEAAASGIPNARQSALEPVPWSQRGVEPELVDTVKGIVFNKDRLTLSEQRQQHLATAPGMGVARSSNQDIARLYQSRLTELNTGRINPELEFLRRMFGPPTQEVQKPLTPAAQAVQEGKAEVIENRGYSIGAGMQNPQGDFGLFGKDKLRVEQTGGIRINEAMQKGRKGESGAINLNVLRDALKSVKERLIPSGSAKLSPGEFRPSVGRDPVFRFQNQAVAKKMASEYKGVGAVPLIGPTLDPRAKIHSEVDRAIVTNHMLRSIAKNMETLYAEQTRSLENPFPPAGEGKVKLPMSEDYLSDAVEYAMHNPGSQLYTPEQKAAVAFWTWLKGEVGAYAQSQGVKSYVDEYGNTIDLTDPHFPRHSYGKQIPGEANLMGKETPRKGSGGPPPLPGSKSQSDHPRYYDTEAEGYAAGIRYEPDFYLRIGRWYRDVLNAIADERLASDPALQGRPLSSLGPKFMEEGTPGSVPVFRGRVFPEEIANKIKKHYLERPSSELEKVADVNDAARALQLTGDMSYLFVQQLGLLGSRPWTWAKGAAAGLQGVFTDKGFQNYLVKNDRFAKEFIEVGGRLGHEEYMAGTAAGGLARKIPIAGTWLHRFNRSMTAGMSVGKLEMYKSLREHWPVEQRRELVEAIETTFLSGRMEEIGLSHGRALAERLVSQAPSYYRAGMSQLADAARPTGGPASVLAKETLGGLLASLTAGMVGIYYGLGMDDEDVKKRLNPLNKNWLKVPVKLDNGTVLEVGPSNIAMRMLQTLAKAAVAPFDNDARTDVMDEIVKFGKYRTSSIIKGVFEFVEKKDVTGRPISRANALARMSTPISMQEFFGPGDMEQKTKTAAASFVGLSAKPENVSEARNRMLKEESKKLKKPYGETTARERAEMMERIAPAMDYKKSTQTGSSAEYIEQQNKLRKEEMNKAMPDDVKEYLAKHNVSLPGWQEFLNFREETIILTPDERVELKAELTKAFEAAVRRQMAAGKEGFGLDQPGLKQKQKEGRLSNALEAAAGRVRARLRRKLAEPAK